MIENGKTRIQPLNGQVVVNTRAEHQAAEFTRLLEAQGATVLHYPAIAIVPPRDTAPLDQALQAAVQGRFDWLILTSANTVPAVKERLQALELPVQALTSLRVAAVGPATAQATEQQLVAAVDLVPEEFVAESLAHSLDLAPGTRVFLPQSAIARPVLADALRAAGVEVTEVPAYRTIVGNGGVELPVLLFEGRVDAITFTSASTVRNCVHRLQWENGSPDMLMGICVACIGPISASMARQYGIRVDVIPKKHTLDALAHALAAWFAARTRP